MGIIMIYLLLRHFAVKTICIIELYDWKAKCELFNFHFVLRWKWPEDQNMTIFWKLIKFFSLQIQLSPSLAYGYTCHTYPYWLDKVFFSIFSVCDKCVRIDFRIFIDRDSVGIFAFIITKFRVRSYIFYWTGI